MPTQHSTSTPAGIKNMSRAEASGAILKGGGSEGGLGGGGEGGRAGGTAGDGGEKGENLIEWAGQKTLGPACCAPGNPFGMKYVVPYRSCVCDVCASESVLESSSSSKSGHVPSMQSASTGGGGGAEGGKGQLSL